MIKHRVIIFVYVLVVTIVLLLFINWINGFVEGTRGGIC